MFDIDEIRELAKSLKQPVRSLLALDHKNDPFYARRGNRVEAAEWFATVWQQYGGDAGHLRRIHYRLVSQPEGTVLLPNGRPYQNTENDWHYLAYAGRDARYLDLIPLDALIDRRNAEPMFFANDPLDPNEDRVVDCTVQADLTEIDYPEMPVTPSFDVTGLDARQDFLVEVWIEKSGENDWLVPLCQRREVNLTVGIGEQSEIRSRELAQRSAECAVPVRVIYLSDFDPAGRSMPKAVARKVEFTIQKLGLDVDFQLIPVALLPEQVRSYQLPRTPIKEGERRKDKFEQTFGFGATELDAMEALYPGELGRIVEAEIDNFLDQQLASRVRIALAEQMLPLRRIEGQVEEQHEDELEELEQDLDEIKSKLRDWEERADSVWQTISEELEEQIPDLSDVDIPRSEVPGETDSFVLFDSTRDYFTQMDAYNAWRDGEE